MKFAIGLASSFFLSACPLQGVVTLMCVKAPICVRASKITSDGTLQVGRSGRSELTPPPLLPSPSHLDASASLPPLWDCWKVAWTPPMQSFSLDEFPKSLYLWYLEPKADRWWGRMCVWTKNSKLILKSYYIHKWYKTHSVFIHYSYKDDTRYKTNT